MEIEEDCEMNEDGRSADERTNLSFRDAVRLRPLMYFGSVNTGTLLEFICNILDPALEEAMLGTCSKVDIVLQDGNVVSILDNGKGSGVNPPSQIAPTGDKIDRPHYRIQASRHGMGFAMVNAVCSAFSVEIRRDGLVWQQRFEQGLPLSSMEPVRSLADGEATGTSINFAPDYTIFQAGEFDSVPLLRRLRELTYLVPGLTISIKDMRSGKNPAPITFTSNAGVTDFVRHVNRDLHALHDVIAIQETVDLKQNYKPLGYSATFDIALQFSGVHQSVILSYMNGVEVEYGGPHMDGLISALTASIAQRASHLEQKKDGWNFGFTEDDSLCGLTAVLSMQHPKPESCNSLYYILSNPELEDAVSDLVEQAIEAFAEAHPEQMQRIVENCLANKARRLQRRYGAT